MCLYAHVMNCVQDHMYTPEQLHELMSQSDYVVMATPHTPATDKMVDARALAAMKQNGEGSACSSSKWRLPASKLV